MTPRSLQEWVHWLEVGAGGRWVARGAVVLGVVLLSLRVGYTQFHGPLTETTLAQAVVGRQLADGKGFTTLVNYPQTAAWLKARAVTSGAAEAYRFDPAKAFPELHQPPLYSLAIAGALKLFPGKWRTTLFDTVPKPPDGFRADYVLLVLNIVLLWLAAWLTLVIGRRLFDERVGTVAMLGLLLSSAIWSETVAVNGAPLMMVILLAFFLALVRLDEGAAGTGKMPWHPIFSAGLLCGLAFLGDYSAGIAIAAAAGWIGFRFSGGQRGRALAVLGLGFLVVAGPWIVRNIAIAGGPAGLAWQGIALKAGDPTADPETVKATLSAAVPSLDLNKLGNKMLTSLQKSLRERIWAGGAIFFVAFFVTSLVYRFRLDRVNRARWLLVATLGLLMVAQAFFDSGEGERLPVVYATPLIAVFGAGFFFVLIASSERLRGHGRWAAAVLLAVQALPLAHDTMEPRRLHFSYPPYYPGLFMGMREEMLRRGGPHPGWLADVPAGAAWYSGQRLWARPATLRDFYGVCQEQTQVALVLTPHTLDRPFFSELTKRNIADGRLGDWSEVYTALVTNRFPAGFPLSLPQKVADNFYVLIDPLAMNTPARKQ
jgi:hypothetical protein